MGGQTQHGKVHNCNRPTSSVHTSTLHVLVARTVRVIAEEARVEVRRSSALLVGEELVSLSGAQREDSTYRPSSSAKFALDMYFNASHVPSADDFVEVGRRGIGRYRVASAKNGSVGKTGTSYT